MDCPARMSDGRFTTDLRSSSRRDETYKHLNNIVRDDEYRAFLQKNGEILISKMWEYNKTHNSCNHVKECVHTYDTRVYPPQMEQEFKAYNDMSRLGHKNNHPCKHQEDYRMN